MKKSIIVTTTAGNGGPYLSSLENGIPWVLTVTSGTMDRFLGATLIMKNKLKITRWSTFIGESMLEKLPLFYSEHLSTCNSHQLLSTAPKGTILLCDIRFLELQAKAILKSHIKGAILINNPSNLLSCKDLSFPYVVVWENIEIRNKS